jgi:LysR family glycine cleavage system transcriptional activator
VSDEQSLSLNAVRVFVQIARERSVTRAAKSLGITQSSVSRHLAVLEAYLGDKLIERRGRSSELTHFGRLFVEVVAEPLETILFTAQRMRRRDRADANRLVVRTSLSTFAYSLLIPNLQDFSRETGGAVVDIISSLSMPSTTDGFDILLTRDLVLTEPADHWDLYHEQLVCVGTPQNVSGRSIASVRSTPVLSIMSRPDILPAWARAMDLKPSDIQAGARYDHHYLALPAVTTGKCLLVTPEILVAELIRQGILEVMPGSRAPSGMVYRAYAVDRSRNPDLSRAFCRWIAKLCKRMASSGGDRNQA